MTKPQSFWDALLEQRGKWIDEGRCAQCGEPGNGGTLLCLKHRTKANKRIKLNYRKKYGFKPSKKLCSVCRKRGHNKMTCSKIPKNRSPVTAEVNAVVRKETL